MKKLILIVLLLGVLNYSWSYWIGGAYARLIECKWGKYGYEYGYIGLYDLNGDYFRIYFGDNYCQY